MFKKDHLRLGLILGFLAPVLGFFVYYLVKFRLFSFEEFLQLIRKNPSMLTGIISLSLIANAIVFTLYINRQKDQTAKGVFIATCIYALVALSFKWFV
ncbi:MAG: hypothetical protein ACN4EP_06360 [Sediminibacterium sp.]|nr:hypothetical protein [uncultured Sediminibacterium sp.]